VRAAALLSGAALSAALLTACDGGATEPPFLSEELPTLTAAPTESGGMDGFREFATLIQTALTDKQAQFFTDRAAPTKVLCTGQEQLGPCAGQQADTVESGVWYGLWGTDAVGLVAPEEVGSNFDLFVSMAAEAESDSFGTGEVALYALASSPAGAFGEGESYYAILTGIFDGSDGPERRIAAYEFSFNKGRWGLPGVVEAGVLFDEWLSGDCAECYDHWERWEGTP
jgi:hypothetical protein